jgi:hypothetical protein
VPPSAEKLQSKLSFTPEQTLDTVADSLTFLRVVHITGGLKAIPADPDDSIMMLRSSILSSEVSLLKKWAARLSRPAIRYLRGPAQVAPNNRFDSPN